MDAETLALLRAVDDPVAREFPEGWPAQYPDALRRVREAHADVEQALGVAFRLDDQVQDASYFAAFFHCVAVADGAPGENFSVIFSAFGSLFTVLQSRPGLASPAQVAQIRAIVSRHGFRYVDAAALEEPYTGAHPAFRNETWMGRFFSYL